MAINYQKFLDEAMLSLVKKVLIHVQQKGLEGNHHLYIAFRTQDSLVELSARMKQRYPDQIMIVLQHQFDNLVVEENSFSVGLSFDDIYERIKVPFHSIVGFADPSVHLNIQFTYIEQPDSIREEKKDSKSHIDTLNSNKNSETAQKKQGSIYKLDRKIKSPKKIQNSKSAVIKKSKSSEKEVDNVRDEDLPSNVIMLDKFRNKE